MDDKLIKEIEDYLKGRNPGDDKDKEPPPRNPVGYV